MPLVILGMQLRQWPSKPWPHAATMPPWYEKTWHDMWCDVMWCAVTWRDVMWCDVMWCELSWAELSWAELSWGEVRWGEVRCGAVMWCDVMWCDMVWSDTPEPAKQHACWEILNSLDAWQDCIRHWIQNSGSDHSQSSLSRIYSHVLESNKDATWDHSLRTERQTCTIQKSVQVAYS